MKTKIGIYFGGFCPMHLGHELMVNKAIDNNDFAFVEVSGWKGEPRAERIGLPLEERAAMIADYFGDRANVFFQDDHEIGLDGSMSSHNWTVWTYACFSHIMGRKAVNAKGEEHICTPDDMFTFYVGDTRYVDDILNNQKVVPAENIKVELVSRQIFPISATMIRENPAAHLNDVIKPFQPYIAKLC